MERETVFPHCSCLKIDAHHKYLNITSCSNGETCDHCNHYVIWKPLNSKTTKAGKDTEDNKRWEHSQKAFFLQEYKVCLVKQYRN